MSATEQSPAGVQSGGDTVEVVGTIVIVAQVFLARPHELDRVVHLLGDCGRHVDAVNVEPPAEGAAHELVVDDDFVGRQPGCRRHRVLCPHRHLRAHPDLGAIRLDVQRAIQRLHRRVREEGQLVNLGSFHGGPGDGCLGVTLARGHHAGLEGGALHCRDDRRQRRVAVGAGAPNGPQSGEPLLGCPHVIADDGNGDLAGTDDVVHAGHRTGRRLVHSDQPSALDRRDRDRADAHARQPDVDAELRRAVDLGGRVDALGAGADQAKLGRLFQFDVLRYRQRARLGSEVTVAERPAARVVMHGGAFNAATCGVDLPRRGGRLHQHRPRDSGGLTQAQPVGARRGGAARRLIVQQRVHVLL